ncbi:orotidine-5'-phosphate decarboxylase [Candidatus Poribacteria bacterium]|nr:orotidine-5'-phosphate decarboxylase [Candidatus Poribacteria bacterium]
MSQNQLIVALDVEDLAAANELVTTLSDDVKWFKIGKQFFTSVGPNSVRLLQKAKKNIFLDLKFHDIPNTVAGAVASGTKIGAHMINMHTSGGFEMMRAAAESAEKQASELGIPQPTLLGVTILTSVDEANFQRDFGTPRRLADQVAYLAELSQKAGLDGVVASPLEIGLIRKVCGDDFVIVTPGVRPAWADSNDQQRVMAPAEAIDAGADYIVVGRPITASDNPREAARRILQEIDQ